MGLLHRQVHPGWLAQQAARSGMADMWRPDEQKARSVSVSPRPPDVNITALGVATAALQLL